MSKIIDITEIGAIIKIHPENPEVIAASASMKMRSGRTLFYLNEEQNAYISYDFLIDGMWVGHLASLPDVRGKKLWDFAYGTAVKMVDNFNLQHLVCFANEDNLPLKMFISRFKMKKVGEIGQEILYSVDDKQIKEYRR